MRLLFFVAGVLAGVLLAQRFSRSAQGREVLRTVNSTTGEFARTVADSYRARRAEDR